MKHVCVKAAACLCTASTTLGCELPTEVTAIPAPRSMSELPSASTITPPPAATAAIGTVCATPAATAASFRARRAREAGPGISVTRERRCASVGPPTTTEVIFASLFRARRGRVRNVERGIEHVEAATQLVFGNDERR